jgi:uncharacterized protein (DUF1778 family)
MIKINLYPMEFLIPKTIVVTRESALKILDMINNPPEPTEAMKKLFLKAEKEEKVR